MASESRDELLENTPGLRRLVDVTVETGALASQQEDGMSASQGQASMRRATGASTRLASIRVNTLTHTHARTRTLTYLSAL